MTFSKSLNELLAIAKLDSVALENLIRIAIAEDLAGATDVTSVATIPENQRAVAEFRSRKSGVIAGIPVVCAVLEICGITEYEINKSDGEVVSENSLLLTAKGETRALLLAERSALNFIGRLSGIATLTKSWVDEVADTKTEIRDTRKTTPGLRELEKYAVRMGGGENHRFSLSDVALIKDNHVLAAGSVAEAFRLVKAKFPNISVEVEVDSLQQLREVVESVRNAEMERYGARLGEMTDEQREAVDSIVRGIVAKLLHSPSVRLREAAGTPQGERLSAAVRDLFNLE